MHRLNPIVLCALLLVIAYAAENQSNSTHEDKQQDDTMHYEPHVNLTTMWDHDENCTRDDEDSCTKNLDEKGSQNVPAELRDNFTEINDGDNSTSQLRPGSNSNQTNSKICNDTICIPICCELGYRMIRGICTPDDSEYEFPEVHEMGKKVDEVFPLFVSDPCTSERYALDPSLYPEDEYIIMTNGSVYQTLLDSFIDPTTYCFGIKYNKSKYELTICFDATNTTVVEEDVNFNENIILISIFISTSVSLPFLILTFLVYTILPDLWNIHGYTLRSYVGSLFVAYLIIGPFQLMSLTTLSDAVCIGSGMVCYFSFLASFFWLNVISFDIWWTFRRYRPLRIGNVKRREKKKFIMYSIYAWGCASILIIFCLIMDFVPGIPETLIRPEFGKVTYWLTTTVATQLYFYLPVGIIIICNFFLFISTTLKLEQHKNDTADLLRNSESSSHNDNKQWFILYLKLFIVMGITWSMQIISTEFKGKLRVVWYISNLIHSLHGLIIFIIFVWKDKIKKLLLKRFGCREDIFSRNSTRSGCHNKSTPRITTRVTLHEKINLYVQNSNCRAKNSSDENSTDCSNV
ncbi:G-protein coupled receptor Mth2-like [Odontomachus brunneus]|uniref:G-protein coupled receptor Mth2-like n=1 Tax=Odontomachus brunneus TaxID=486640 RepID=UPI0013F18EB0|nr:G-protein coupled receptor Mth2-like [Odontomachus brunneus]XP_032664925.1 G-protein coupled receptor Mth2-like [Odontomachus brunneus]